MTETLLVAYPWVKALHVIAVISWMAGLLYLPRLFVYHCEAPVGSAQSETFKVMEDKLSRLIMRPAMIATLVFGLVLIAIPGTPGHFVHAGSWLWLKLLLVAGLLVAHLFMTRWRDDFANDRNQRPPRFFRIMNEVPTLLMVGIVLCVIVKPF
ncbi:MAG: protoporphyrinogen oxidase HemJ [bacterium]|nr:TIGR00701 family protein [Deltaproteobacteria bacterium]MCP4908696.1 protoporphyrinogen oxidase HemJ [bacterium]